MTEIKDELMDREWGVFKIGDLFETFRRGERQIAEKRKIGDIPYLSASRSNNGVTDFISNPTFLESGAILTSTFCDSFYMKGSFTSSDEMTIFKSKTLNEFIGLFITVLIKNNKEKYHFGMKGFTNRLLKQNILLPITISGEPDLEFMEDYIRKNQEVKLKDYERIILEKISKLQNLGDVGKLEDREWKAFKIGELFEIENCRCQNKTVFKEGPIPYVGATNRNNGTMQFVESNPKLETNGDCLAFICQGEGSVGYSVYKKERFIGSTSIKVGRNPNMNALSALFISAVADKVRGKYNYGYSRSEERLKKESVMLPTTPSGEPDWQFMEDYIKQIKLQKLTEYLDYVNKKLKTLENHGGGGVVSRPPNSSMGNI